jgi:hypothetical protein
MELIQITASVQQTVNVLQVSVQIKNALLIVQQLNFKDITRTLVIVLLIKNALQDFVVIIIALQLAWELVCMEII